MASNDEEPTTDEEDLESGSTKTATRRENEETTSSRSGIRQFLREVRSELRKVAWPTRTETRNYSVIVLISLVFMTTLIFLVDLLFSDLVLRLFNAK
jgi:preprotein translocase subunit SecE